jgi:hypothetical protein
MTPGSRQSRLGEPVGELVNLSWHNGQHGSPAVSRSVPSEEPVRPPGKLIGRQSDVEELPLPTRGELRLQGGEGEEHPSVRIVSA